MRSNRLRLKWIGRTAYCFAIALLISSIGCPSSPPQGSGGDSGTKHKLDVLSTTKPVHKTNISEGMKGVDFSGLTGESKQAALDLLNVVTCDCECQSATVAQCLVFYSSCSEAKKQAQTIVDKVKTGSPVATAVKEMYPKILSKRIRTNLQPLIESITPGKEKDAMVAIIARFVARVDANSLKKTDSEIEDARAVAALFLGDENKGLLKYIEGTSDELYVMHGITYELLPEMLRALFEYYYFSHRPKLREKLFPYLNPGTPEEEMVIAMVADFFGAPELEGGADISAGNAPSMGPDDAPITIYEFSDFQCPYCSRVQSVITEVMNAYPGKVRRVFKNFPLSFHKQAKIAGQAALAADKQGKFWEMQKKIFDNQKKISVKKLEEIAAELGLDMEKFKQDMVSPEVVMQVQNDFNEGVKLGVGGTPTVFINDKKMKNAYQFCPYMEVIEAELNK